MQDFLKFFDEKAHDFPMHLEITYSKICDWCICIYKKGCAEDYPNSEKDGEDAVILCVQDGDMELCFAKAHVALKEWQLEYLLNADVGPIIEHKISRQLERIEMECIKI